MHIDCQNLTIRNATSADATLLCAWWNDGEVMAHAGFPNGLGTTVERIIQSLATNSDETKRVLIIEVEGVPVGEMSYTNYGDQIAAIGIKICVTHEQEKGNGTRFLCLLIGTLFADYGYEKIVLDTNSKNTRAQHVYEKIGFRRIGERIDAWVDQLGVPQSVIDYEMCKEDWQQRFA